MMTTLLSTGASIAASCRASIATSVGASVLAASWPPSDPGIDLPPPHDATATTTPIPRIRIGHLYPSRPSTVSPQVRRDAAQLSELPIDASRRRPHIGPVL